MFSTLQTISDQLDPHNPPPPQTQPNSTQLNPISPGLKEDGSLDRQKSLCFLNQTSSRRGALRAGTRKGGIVKWSGTNLIGESAKERIKKKKKKPPKSLPVPFTHIHMKAL